MIRYEKYKAAPLEIGFFLHWVKDAYNANVFYEHIRKTNSHLFVIHGEHWWIFSYTYDFCKRMEEGYPDQEFILIPFEELHHYKGFII